DFEALRQETKIAISLAMIKATKEIDIVTLDQICGESGVVCGADVIAQFSPGASTGSNNDSGDGEETKSGGGGGVLSGSNNTTGYWENEVSPGKHEYERFSDAICKLETSGCTRDNVLNILNEVGVHPGQEKPFTPGQPYIADADLPFVPFSDHINTIALYDQSEAQIGVRNTTTDDHLLNPGYVERYVVEIGGEIKIRTYGEGEGILGGANVRFVDNTWAPIDSQVSEEFHRRFAP
ncbi:MAG: hypothetical protein Q7U82_09895, partial [Gammaproteobacteria bacterium]|nr:hypothetical protein [Gammaproteobacteria bacterium]